MNKTAWLTAEIVNSYDLNNMSKDAQVGLANAVAFILGSTGSGLTGFTPTQTASPSMTINIAAGQLYQLAVTDANPIGTLPADSTQILQQGLAAAQTIALNSSGLGAGQSKWWLIQAQFQQVPAIRAGDPFSGNRGFYNSTNPPSPLNGPDGLGAPIDTVILGFANVTAIAGAAGTSPAQPTPSSGCVPLFLIQVVQNQTTITTGQIQVHPSAPFLAGLVNQHHMGLPGHAPKIDLTSEVQHILPYGNLPVTNTTPPTVGGSITASPGISITTFGTVNPGGVVQGNIGDRYVNTAQGTEWNCTATGTPGTWQQVGNPNIAVYQSTFPFTVIGGQINQCDVGSNTSTTLNAASSYGGLAVEFINIGAAELSILPHTGESLPGLAANAAYVLGAGESVKWTPRMGGSGNTWIAGA